MSDIQSTQARSEAPLATPAATEVVRADPDTIVALMAEMDRFARGRLRHLQAAPRYNARLRTRNEKLGHQLSELIGLTRWLGLCLDAGEVLPIGEPGVLRPVRGRGGGRR